MLVGDRRVTHIPVVTLLAYQRSGHVMLKDPWGHQYGSDLVASLLSAYNLSGSDIIYTLP